MNFRESLDRHLDAIRDRNLATLATTLSDQLVLVTAEGRIVRGSAGFLELHRDWFLLPGWQLDAQVIEVFEGADLGVAVLRLDYQEPGKPSSPSVLTLVFRRTDGRWLMVQDQNTPILAKR